MKLKKLDIYGFKSFAERTEMVFDTGITGVVGPNGSGKSNISDAVRWVLGEQSAKTLRGAKMEDVIFGGTEKRKPLSYCEVSLTLDNADGALPVQYSEIMITRRVYRSGESEYYLNKSACRLKDIIDLFRDTGIGKEGYSLIGQGRIDEILSARSEDRRAVFEEAAGIAKYKARKAEAERKIENTNQNLTRVEDIIAEAERQVGPLSQQAEKARTYIRYMDELRALDTSQFVMRYDAAKQRIEQQNSVAAERKNAIAQAQSNLDASRAARDALDRAQAQADAQTQDLRDAVVEATRALEERQGAVNVLVERMQSIDRERERLEGEQSESADAIAEMRARSQTLASEHQTHMAQNAARQSELNQKEAELAKTGERLDEDAQRIEDRKENLMEAINRLSDVKSARARLTAMRQAISERIDACQGEEEQLAGQLESIDQATEDERQAVSGAQSRRDEALGQEQAIEAELAKNREARACCQEEGQKLTLSRQQTETRLKVLREMARDYEGYQFSVKQVMQRADKTQDKGIIGVVASILRVPRELERATDMVLGGALQNIIVETEQDAKRMIEYLRQNRYGRATFLPVSAVTGRTLSQFERQALNTPGCLGVLSELVGFDKRYQGIVDNLLGRTVVARDLDAGIEIMRRGRHAFRLVTLEGDVMHSGGSMTGGSVQSRVTNLLSRDREIAEHENLLKKQDADIAAARKNMASLEAERAGLHTRQGEAAAALRGFEDELLKLNQQLAQAEKERASIEERAQRIQHERDNLKVNLEDVMNELSGLTGKQGAAESNHEQMQRDIAAEQKALAERRQQFDAAREQLTQEKIALAERIRDDSARESEIKRLIDDANAREAAMHAADEKVRGSQAARAELEGKLDEARTMQDGAAKTLSAAKVRLSEADTDRDARAKRRREIEEELERWQGDVNEFTDQLHRIEMQIDRARGDLDAMQQRIWTEYEMTYEACAERADRTITLNDADARIAVLRNRIRDLGGVNVNAAEEYDAANARLRDLTAQRDDLLSAREDLRRIIDDLTSQMSQQFISQFRLLNERFGATFKALFGGGSAKLILQDEGDALNCGIDIAAQPPGKKLQMLSLLSGGERALTAIAILFAMLDIRPTPFCILDEIEAALDDANIDNFAQYLSRYSEKTQFIVVTHRKGTMECCDTLYGVAMEEKGVSRMVSVALADAQRSV